MVDSLPYFAGLITLLFSAAFSYAITDGWDFKNKDGNLDKTANFLKAFDDAKILFYHLPSLKNKFQNSGDKPLSSMA